MKAAPHPLATLALAVTIAACGAAQTGAGTPVGRESQDQITIEVENRNFNDARIYLIVFGERTRLGQVAAQTTRTFSFAAGPNDVRIEVSFIGGGSFVTDPMSVSPGDELMLQITQNNYRLRRP